MMLPIMASHGFFFGRGRIVDALISRRHSEYGGCWGGRHAVGQSFIWASAIRNRSLR